MWYVKHTCSHRNVVSLTNKESLATCKQELSQYQNAITAIYECFFSSYLSSEFNGTHGAAIKESVYGGGGVGEQAIVFFVSSISL